MELMEGEVRERDPGAHADSARKEKMNHNKIAARLYVPKDYEMMEGKSKEKFDEIRGMLEKAPEEWYSVRVLDKHLEGDPEGAFLFFGGMWCYDMDLTLAYLKRLLDTPSFHLRK